MIHPESQVLLREATPEDHAGVARICRASGRDPWAPGIFEAQPGRVVMVATSGGDVVAAAKTHHHEEPEGDAPAGHYLGGIVVDPQWRRQGIGSRLVKARLEWIWERSECAFYFTDEDNHLSMELHRSFGFTPIAAGPEMRGVRADGEGAHLVLFRAVRRTRPGRRGDGVAASALTIRPYNASDAPATLELFFSAIRTTASADYSAEQIDAWAYPNIGLDEWGTKREACHTAVAIRDDTVVGFTDVDRDGYIDMLFVAPAHGRSGVATALLDWVLETAGGFGIRSLTTYASITARPFFEGQGFVVQKERHPVVNGVVLTNYAMSRPLA